MKRTNNLMSKFIAIIIQLDLIPISISIFDRKLENFKRTDRGIDLS